MFLLLLMFLGLPCSSFQVVRLLALVVESFSTLTLVLIRIVTRELYLVLALGAVTSRVHRSLTGFTFPLLPPPLVSSPLLPPLPTLCGIIVLVICVALVSHP